MLFGARDWFGIKPLYTYTDERGSFFASEKKSLLDVASPGTSAEVDATALQHYLTLQYVPEPASMHTRDPPRRVRHATSRCGPARPSAPHRYFHPDFAIKPVPDADKLYREIAEALEDSVEKHMRADVTVGSFLSGGIDSTAVAALAKRHNPKLLTFTTGFEREGYSEIDVAAESAAAIGVEHITKVVTAEEMMETLPLIVWYLDDPVADPALVPLYFIAREARKHVKVVLSGEGADELFGGYTIYREPISLRAFDRVPAPAAARARPAVDPDPRGHARQGPAAPRLHRHRGALLRQRAHLPSGRDAGPVQGLRPGRVLHRRHRAALRAAPRTSTTRPACSTSTCSPGCAATSSSRPTR